MRIHSCQLPPYSQIFLIDSGQFTKMTHLVKKSENFAEKRKICITEKGSLVHTRGIQKICGILPRQECEQKKTYFRMLAVKSVFFVIELLLLLILCFQTKLSQASLFKVIF